MRKTPFFLSLLLVLTLVFNSTVHAQKQFSDIDEEKHSWAMESINFMIEKGIVSGFPDGTFRPDAQVSKAEIIVMVYRLFDKYKPNLSPENDYYKIDHYFDVPDTHWAYKEISSIIIRSQWFSYYYSDEDGSIIFEPEKKVTRLGVTALVPNFFMDELDDITIYNLLSQMKDIPIKISSNESELDLFQEDGRYYEDRDTLDKLYPLLFLDEGNGDYRMYGDYSIVGWYIANLYSKNIMVGDNNSNFNPNKSLSRAEAMTILHRIYQYVDQKGELSIYSSK